MAPYAYTAGDPINTADLTGKWWVDLGAVVQALTRASFPSRWPCLPPGRDPAHRRRHRRIPPPRPNRNGRPFTAPPSAAIGAGTSPTEPGHGLTSDNGILRPGMINGADPGGPNYTAAVGAGLAGVGVGVGLVAAGVGAGATAPIWIAGIGVVAIGFGGYTIYEGLPHHFS